MKIILAGEPPRSLHTFPTYHFLPNFKTPLDIQAFIEDHSTVADVLMINNLAELSHVGFLVGMVASRWLPIVAMGPASYLAKLAADPVLKNLIVIWLLDKHEDQLPRILERLRSSNLVLLSLAYSYSRLEGELSGASTNQ